MNSNCIILLVTFILCVLIPSALYGMCVYEQHTDWKQNRRKGESYEKYMSRNYTRWYTEMASAPGGYFLNRNARNLKHSFARIRKSRTHPRKKKRRNANQ